MKADIETKKGNEKFLFEPINGGLVVQIPDVVTAKGILIPDEIKHQMATNVAGKGLLIIDVCPTVKDLKPDDKVYLKEGTMLFPIEWNNSLYAVCYFYDIMGVIRNDKQLALEIN